MAVFTLCFPADYVLHIGAGSGAAAEGYVRAGLDPVVLVEADSEALPGLKALAQRFGPVQAVEAVVSPQGGPATFMRCNFSGLNSLSEPADALYRLFPGLRVEARLPVETRAVADILKGCGLPEAGRGLLVIEAPGQALALLEALQAASLLQRFQTIRVQEGRQSLYQAAPTLEQLQQRLADLGYASWLEAAPEDPDRPHAVAWRNAAALESGAAQAGLQQRLDLCAADLAELQQRYGALLHQKEAYEDLLRRLADRLAPLAGNNPGGNAAEPEA
ncbi:hypothetical protein [Leisingera sp. ANG59]|uniref:hypothetical protein n=1 Tax=Leisingera sp. ANG59 TaxID=2675221 RepID=UPI0015731B39|nr:hypothetical protein [Leisingera sp. ANG59]NSY39547.1 hypothetical protein [Leisingera sp. ANG59]